MKTWQAVDIQGPADTHDFMLAFFQGRRVTGIEERGPGHLVVYQVEPWLSERDGAALQVYLHRAGFSAAQIQVSVSTTPEADWLAEWKAHWSAAPLGKRLWIVPAWLEHEPVPPGRRAVLLDPGMAFGTGTHETTRLAWELLEELLTRPPSPPTVLELGAGTGILSLGVSLLHPELTVAATEVDPDSARRLAHNAALNPEAALLAVCSGEVPARPGWAGAAVVNMTQAEHLEVRERLLPALAPACRLVLSGLFPHQVRGQASWWQQHGFTQVSERAMGEWAACLLNRDSNG